MPQDNAVESFLRTNIDEQICTKAPEGSSTTYNGGHVMNFVCHGAHIAVHSVGAGVTAVVPGKSSDHDVSRISSHYNAVVNETLLPAANSICKSLPGTSDEFCDSLFSLSNKDGVKERANVDQTVPSGNDNYGGIDVSHWIGGFNDNDYH